MMLEMQKGGNKDEGEEGDRGGGRNVVTQSALNSRVRTAVLMLQHSGRATKDPRFQQAVQVLLAELPDEGAGAGAAASTENGRASPADGAEV